jgi:hypothetical protein
VSLLLNTLLLVALAVGMSRCLSSARMPECNRAAFHGQVWLLASLGPIALEGLINAVVLPHPEPILHRVTLWIFRICFIVAFFLSSRALWQIRIDRARWKRGERQAWLVVGLAALFVLLNAWIIIPSLAVPPT